MRLKYDIKEVDIPTLYRSLLEAQRAGYRLTQICATAFEGYNELIYSVSKDYDFESYKVIVPHDVEITTVSDFFPSAMLYENEMKELYGVKVKSINVDYNNKFYRIAKETPFKKAAKETVKIVKKDEEVKD